MDIQLMRRLLRDRVISRGVDWLRAVLDAAGVDKISLLSHKQLVAILEERSDA
jgi:hypothetical protein